MNQTQRLYRIDQLLNERKLVPLDVFLADLEVSSATFKRDLDYLRGRLNAPIVWDRHAGGYRFENDRLAVGAKYELPGLWFNSSEILALLSMRQLMSSLSPGLLTAQVEPLLAKMRLLLGGEDLSLETFEKRVRICRVSARSYEPEHFTVVATAVMQRKRLTFEHYNKFRDEIIQREISPQRLTHYRENWYVDAWCHLRNELRSFGLSSLRSAHLLESAAREIPESDLISELDSGYGIFSGAELEWAELIFTPERARWVSQETWHVEQECWHDEEGRYHLRFPYSDPREVSMEILRHAPEVTIVAPESLRKRVLNQLQSALQNI